MYIQLWTITIFINISPFLCFFIYILFCQSIFQVAFYLSICLSFCIYLCISNFISSYLSIKHMYMYIYYCYYYFYYRAFKIVYVSVPMLWQDVPSSPLFIKSIPLILPVAHVGMTGRYHPHPFSSSCWDDRLIPPLILVVANFWMTGR